MFKHILFPTDGSPAAASAIGPCVQFAKEIGASITALHVIPPFHVFTYMSEMIDDTREQFSIDCQRHARAYLGEVEQAAAAMHVPCSSLYVTAEHPYEAIIQTGLDKHCDLIAMASHGHRGVKALLLGSETQKVLSHSAIPVLVYRQAG